MDIGRSIFQKVIAAAMSGFRIAYLTVPFELSHNSVTLICMSWYDESGLSPKMWRIWEKDCYHISNLYSRRIIITAVYSLILAPDTTIYIFCFCSTFNFSAIFFLLSYTFTSFVIFCQIEMCSSTISSPLFTNAGEISSDDHIQSVLPYLLKMWEKSSRSTILSSGSTITRRSSSILTRWEATNFLYGTLTRATARSCRSPWANRATNTAVEWWPIYFCVISAKLVP